MSPSDVRERVQKALLAFQTANLADASLALLADLGYESKKRLRLKPNTLAGFQTQFPHAKDLNQNRALVSQWKTIDFLFQLSDEEVSKALDSGQEDLFGTSGEVNQQRIESYLFFTIDLKPRVAGGGYTRTELSGITRAINKLFAMPVMLLFRHGDTISLAVINRRLHKLDSSKDVLEKVTLVKDICYADPLRAHIEILNDLSITSLYDVYQFTNFVGLHKAWEKRLATYALNERFYREIADWYFEALDRRDVVLPKSIEENTNKSEQKEQKSLFFIRLLTRLIFCWFLQEKRLIPRDIFRERVMKDMLKDASPKAGTYYTAFLQNLFFATLNQEQGKRGWRKKYDKSRDGNVGVTNLWRYADAFKDSAALETLLRDEVPFVNGGLFDCLDDQLSEPKEFLDGFSERKDNTLLLPNALFFAGEHVVDLSDVYQDKRHSKEKVSGLINILSRYKFTVEENTPLEEEIALDPELLGKVFENLLASFNTDTQTTARKSLGAFYTPRSVVSYMVDEALITYLATKVPSVKTETLKALMKSHPEDDDPRSAFSKNEIKALVHAIGSVRTLDHAAGSGAFLMGALHRLVDLLQKLDPNNESWKRDRLAEAPAYIDNPRMQNAPEDELLQVEQRITDIEKSFNTSFHELDYARKLYLIENCIYGVDIQPVACQIAKLRFFIALIVDQKVRKDANNLGVTPMPNLETKVVAANSLLSIEQLDLFSEGTVDQLRQELLRVRHEHFAARTPARKKHLRELDGILRQNIAKYLIDSGLPSESAKDLAGWDPYDQNSAATFFDPSWMFGFKQEDALFDIVMANPPYVRQEKIKDQKAVLKKNHPHTFSGTADLYVYFYDRALQLLRPGGVFSFITSNKWYRSAYGEDLRKHLGASVSLVDVIDFGDAEVFTAIAYPTIVVGRNTPPSYSHKFRTLNWDPKTPKEEIDHFAKFYDQHATTMEQSSLTADGWRFVDGASQQLLSRIRMAGVPLGHFVDKRFYRGVLTGLNEAFVVNRETRDRLIREDARSEELLKPFLRGRDVKRWRIEYKDLWLILIESSENKRHAWTKKTEEAAERIFSREYPGIFRHFQPLRDKLIARCDQGQYYWELRSCAYYDDFEGPKVFYPDIYEHQSFAYDDKGFFSTNTTYFIPDGTEAKYLTALLNSRLVEWFYSQVSNRIRGGYLRAFTDYMKNIPIPKPPSNARRCLESLGSVAPILAADGQNAEMLQFIESVIDAIVYELYFPDDLHSIGVRPVDVVEKANLPDIQTVPETKRMEALREAFERVSHAKHPLRQALDRLEELEVVQLIKGGK